MISVDKVAAGENSAPIVEIGACASVDELQSKSAGRMSGADCAFDCSTRKPRQQALGDPGDVARYRHIYCGHDRLACEGAFKGNDGKCSITLEPVKVWGKECVASIGHQHCV